jgi:hypothetical protein
LFYYTTLKNDFPPGPIKNQINAGLYAVLLFSFLSMQTYAEWNKYQMKNTPQISNQNMGRGIFNQTGLLTSGIAFLSVSHICLIYLTPAGLRTLSFYIAKVIW